MFQTTNIQKPIAFACALGIYLFLTGCTTFAPSDKKIAEADFGDHMSQNELQSLADDLLADVLKDPESRRIEWGRSGKAWVWTGLLVDGHKYGYGLEAFVNARNGFGGYTGSKPYLFLGNNGKITWYTQIGTTGNYGFVEKTD